MTTCHRCEAAAKVCERPMMKEIMEYESRVFSTAIRYACIAAGHAEKDAEMVEEPERGKPMSILDWPGELARLVERAEKVEAERDALKARCDDLAKGREHACDNVREQRVRAEKAEARLANATQSTVEMGAEILGLRASVSELTIKRRVDDEHHLRQRALVEAERDEARAAQATCHAGCLAKDEVIANLAREILAERHALGGAPSQGSAMREIVRVLDKLPPHERAEVIRGIASIYNVLLAAPVEIAHEHTDTCFGPNYSHCPSPDGAGRAEAPASLRGEARDRDPQGELDFTPGSAGSPAPGAGRTDGLDRGETR